MGGCTEGGRSVAASVDSREQGCAHSYPCPHPLQGSFAVTDGAGGLSVAEPQGRAPCGVNVLITNNVRGASANACMLRYSPPPPNHLLTITLPSPAHPARCCCLRQSCWASLSPPWRQRRACWRQRREAAAEPGPPPRRLQPPERWCSHTCAAWRPATNGLPDPQFCFFSAPPPSFTFIIHPHACGAAASARTRRTAPAPCGVLLACLPASLSPSQASLMHPPPQLNIHACLGRVIEFLACCRCCGRAVHERACRQMPPLARGGSLAPVVEPPAAFDHLPRATPWGRARPGLFVVAWRRVCPACEPGGLCSHGVGAGAACHAPCGARVAR